MAEYIEREAIEYPYLYMSMWGLNSSTCKVYNEGVKAVHDVISAIPAADVVAVVRCKDCKYRSGLNGRPPYMFYICTCAEGLTGAVRENHFCSYGERRGDNATD